MSLIKIIFFDVDGTLIEQKKDITPKTVEALRALQANGIKICIASGRAPFSMPKIDGIDFDVYIAYNGSLCYTPDNKTIFNKHLGIGDVHMIIENAETIDKHVAIATKDRIVANGSDKDLLEYFSFSKNKLPISDDFDNVAATQIIYQMMVSGRKTDYDLLLRETDDAKIAAWWDRAVDIIPAGSGKGNAVNQVLKYFGYSPKNAMAFGDGNNDIPMFDEVGYGIAMGNASDKLKEVAADTTVSVQHDGIYRYCKEHNLI